MKSVLNVIRFIVHKLGLFLLANLLILELFLLPAVPKLTSPDQIKSWLNEAGTYKTALDSLPDFIELPEELENNQDQNEPSIFSEIIGNKQLIKTITGSIKPEFIQTQTEDLIDGIYAWMEGKTSQPQFSLSLVGAQKDVVNSLVATLSKELNKLPVCTQQQLAQGYTTINSLCRPPGSKKQLNKEVKKIINQEMFDRNEDNPLTAEFTAEDLGLDQDILETTPMVYGYVSMAPLYVGLAIVLIAGLVVLTAKGYGKGIREVGVVFISMGTLSLLMAFIMQRLSAIPIPVPEIEGSGSNSADIINDIVRPLSEAITSDIVKSAYIWCVITIVLGVIALVVGMKLNRQSKENKLKEDSLKEINAPPAGSKPDNPDAKNS